MRQLLSGNEAIALGAFAAGVTIGTGYPGTPSTEILEHFGRYPGVRAEWAPNEKVALDVGVGAAYAGARALVTMKHVGVNVAADSLFYAAYTGVRGGLVIVTADDPGMHSSQNEQDNRQFARFARVPMLEPSDSQEARDFTLAAYELSEQFTLPVFLRTTTRVAHSKSVVEWEDEAGERAGAAKPQPRFVRDAQRYVMVPGNARRRHAILEEQMDSLRELAETCRFNRVEMGDRRLGVVASGIAYQYAREVLPDASFLKLGLSFPLPEALIRRFAAEVERLLVIEELDPFFEEHIRLLGLPVEGKRYFSLLGELDPDRVADGAARAGILPGRSKRSEELPPPVDLPVRPPMLCVGCGHRNVFYVLKKLKLVITGDIGCYTLAVMPPLSAMDTCGCMGASIGVAHGVNSSGAAERAVAVLGDSTFFHSGIAPLLNVVYNRGNSVTIVLDNGTTAMTGHQDHPGTGATLHGEQAPQASIEAIVRALGVEEVMTVDPYDIEAMERVVRAALACGKPAVVVARHPCVLRTKEKYELVQVDLDACNSCGLCLLPGCPAVVRDGKTVTIDESVCSGCGLCQQVCRRDAIKIS